MADGQGLSPKKIVLVCVGVLALGGGVWLIARSAMGGDAMKALTDRRTMIDAETGEVFEDMPLPTGAPIPYEHPRTGASTLYPAEKCFWTADGKATLEPTYVLLNEFRGQSGPTTCPDCGRRVVAHNPMPPDELLVQAAEAEGG